MTPAHRDAVRALQQNDRYMEYEGGSRSDADVTTYLERSIAHWAHAFGTWVLCDRSTDDAVGLGGLHHLDVNGVDEVEVGYGRDLPRGKEASPKDPIKVLICDASSVVRRGIAQMLGADDAILVVAVPENATDPRALDIALSTVTRVAEILGAPI